MQTTCSRKKRRANRAQSQLLARLCSGIILSAIATFSLVIPCLHAQTVSGTISGTVTDPSGAIVANAAVQIKNTGTSQTRNGVTNSTGFFSFPALPPGEYVVDVSGSGFQKATSNLTLAVGQIVNIKFQLKVGGSTEKVVVNATDSVGLETQGHDLNTVLSAKSMENLPQYTDSRGETFALQTQMVGVQLIEKPGAQPSTGNNVTNYNTWSNALYISGQGPWVTTYLQDGVVDMDYFDQTATVQPPVEATQEVEVIRNNPNARYDGANVVNVVSKSGTDTFHGRAYEELQNDKMNARGYNAGPLGETRYNQFGADGGWLVPFIHKKVFFFADYQGYRLIAYKFLQAILPTAAERSGDFSADLAANPRTKQPATVIYDPNTYVGGGASGPGVLSQFNYDGHPNVIDPARITPFAKEYLDELYPLPNLKNTSLGRNYGSESSRTKFEHDDYLFRGDYNISDKDHLYGAYNTGNPRIIRPEFVDNCLCAEPNELYGTDIYAEESHVFTPFLVNTGRIGYSRAVTGKNFGQVGNGTDYFTKFGLTGLSPVPAVWGWPNANPGGFSGPGGNPTDATEDSYQASDEVNWIHGNHSVFFGAELDKHFYKGVWDTGNPNGSLKTNGEYTYNGSKQAAWQRPGAWVLGSVAVPYANQLADFLLGYYSATDASAGTQVGWFNQFNIMPYIQDDWRVTKKLTVNLGLRYDNYSSPKEENHHAGIYDVPHNTYTLGSYAANNFNFSPRIGFAYALNEKTTIHSGFGLYYYQYGYVDLVGMMNDPYYITQLNSTQTQVQPVIWPSSNTNGNPDIAGSTPGQQEFFTLTNAEAVWLAMPAPAGVIGAGSTTFAPKMPTSYVEQWNLAVQRLLGKNWLFTADYVGSENHHGYYFSNVNLASLPGPNDTNASSAADINSRRPFQAIQGNLTQDSKWGSANYNGFETQIRKSFSGGFEITSNFVWQESMDTGSSDNGHGMAGLNPRVDYGRSDFNQKYIYKLSGIYELPIGRGRSFLNGGRWWQNQLGGWRLSGDLSVNAGYPFSVIATDSSNTGGGITMRATQSCNGNSLSHRSFNEFFNVSCYAQPAVNTFGNERRNDLTGPRDTNLDVSVFKEFPIYEHMKFQWRTDAFSVLNHPLPQAPDNKMTDTAFGQITGWAGAREIQLSAKILW